MFITKYSALATRLFIYLKDNKRAQSIAKYYSKMSDKGDVVAFQDMIDCFEYLKHYNHFNQKVLLTLHTNGDFWSMWYFTLPKLKSRAMSGFRNNIEQVLLKGVDVILDLLLIYLEINFVSNIIGMIKVFLCL